MVIVYVHARVFVSSDCLSIGFFLLMGNLGAVLVPVIERVSSFNLLKGPGCIQQSCIGLSVATGPNTVHLIG